MTPLDQAAKVWGLVFLSSIITGIGIWLLRQPESVSLVIVGAVALIAVNYFVLRPIWTPIKSESEEGDDGAHKK